MTDALDLKIDAALDRVTARYRGTEFEKSTPPGHRKPTSPDPKLQAHRDYNRAWSRIPKNRARIIAQARARRLRLKLQAPA